jgi:uncharacterized protein (TIGR03435 family)
MANRSFVAAASRLAGFVSIAALFLGAATAQEAFEVASVKPTNPDEPRVVWLTYPGGRVVITNYTLTLLIEAAYGSSIYRIEGGPDWADSDYYSITAKAPAGSPAAAFVPPAPNCPPTPEIQAMIRSLLADRFGLKVHHETRVLPVYALIIAKGGPKLQPAQDPTAQPKWTVVNGISKVQNRTTAWLVDILERHFARTILDQTGLTGSYDFELKYDSRAHIDPAQDDVERPINSDLESQLGLRLKATKGPVEIIVIDEARRPAAN